MKIRTRLAIAFVTITVVPIVLIFVAAFGLVNYQEHLFQKTYGLSEQIDLLSGNQTQVFNRLTQGIQEEIREAVGENTDLFEEPAYLNKVNEELRDKYSYLVIRKGKDITFCGSEDGRELCERLAPYGDQGSMAGSIYMDGEEQHLVKQIDFRFSDDSQGSVFIVTNVGDYVPEIKALLGEMLLLGVLIISFMGGLLIMWIYRSLLRPLHKLQEATKQIRDGNLDFTLDVDDEDEIGMLCQDFEEMRLRLKESQEEKLQYDKESKELISNISHDLKTPITAIKGYVEGIQDGVASSPEKLNKYIRTIYNKANDMDRLIDELTFYSKIDTNKIPYNFSKINVAEYFGDCVEEVGLDMETRGIELGYFNYVDEDVVVIADAEQMKRVINNIIGNSLKYLDKKKGILNIRIKDDGDFIQVIIEDNGKGIAAKDLPYIFDRFYRTDSSRNSSKGGSGIGLSIVKKIIEDHGGRIWATSKEGIGTEIHFVLRKYQVEIENNGETGLKRGMEEDFDLLILDLMLPGVDGFEICKKIREVKNTPIIMVSAKKDDIDKIRGLGLGADDYITKPFSPSEMVARVKAHLARYERLIGSGMPENEIIEIRGLKIDKTARRVYINGEEKNFTTKEFDLLTFLAQNPNHVFTKEELFREIWDMESLGDIATVTVHIKKIREKIEFNTAKPQYIETIWGVGYRFKV